MALILSIETSTMVCSSALHEDGILLGSTVHKVKRSHSALLPLIGVEICHKSGYSLKNLDAVAVSEGPGSYTGLRIGASTAKGWCFGLSIPLISVPTLDVMIEAVLGKFRGEHVLVSMMDARRMEVYMKVVRQDLSEVWSLQPKILEETCLATFQETTYVFGDGMPKFRDIAHQDNLIFIDDIYPEAANMGRIAFEKYKLSMFSDISSFEPNYLKEWRTTIPKNKLALT